MRPRASSSKTAGCRRGGDASRRIETASRTADERIPSARVGGRNRPRMTTSSPRRVGNQVAETTRTKPSAEAPLSSGVAIPWARRSKVKLSPQPVGAVRTVPCRSIASAVRTYAAMEAVARLLSATVARSPPRKQQQIVRKAQPRRGSGRQAGNERQGGPLPLGEGEQR